MRKIMITGTRSGVGKTTISTALMAAFKNVAPFKVGPDYIDPKFHEFVTGNKSYNLDGFILNKDSLEYTFYNGSKGKDISIVEGVMGLYDGLGNSKENYSSAHVSKLLKIPVILIVDGKGLSTSIAAEVLGYKNFDPELRLEGIIINNVSSERVYNLLKESIEKYAGIECLGYFPKDMEISIESRHLGLVQVEELEDIKIRIKKLKYLANENINLKRIYEIANCENIKKVEDPSKYFINSLRGKIIAIAKDQAFNFYYNLNLDFLEKTGANIIYFSPINDETIPENTDFIYFGGGYPELYLDKLCANKKMMESIKKAYKNNIRIYAECGGFIYLCKGLRSLDGTYSKMTGILDIKVEMKNRLNIKRFGYIKIKTKDEIEINAHEFHYSDLYDINEDQLYFDISKKDGRTWKCAYEKKNVIAGYPHINFYTNFDFFKKIFNLL